MSQHIWTDAYYFDVQVIMADNKASLHGSKTAAETQHVQIN